ncbi:MAG: hypothetical protein ACI4EA_01635 [Candidatus Ornithomonoglobus sp.]
MILQTPAPPELTGNAMQDIAALREWCCILNRQLRYVTENFDMGIRAVNADITGIADTVSNMSETEESTE